MYFDAGRFKKAKFGIWLLAFLMPMILACDLARETRRDWRGNSKLDDDVKEQFVQDSNRRLEEEREESSKKGENLVTNMRFSRGQNGDEDGKVLRVNRGPLLKDLIQALTKRLSKKSGHSSINSSSNNEAAAAARREYGRVVKKSKEDAVRARRVFGKEEEMGDRFVLRKRER